MARVEAIVLAAGASRRFGEANKLLREVAGVPIIKRVIAAVQGAEIPVCVITGWQQERIAAAVAPVPTCWNPDWEQGLGSSLAAGAASCQSGSAILVVLGDMPGVRSDVIQSLMNQLGDQKGTIVVPVYDANPGVWGHPVLFSTDYREALLALSGDHGARMLLQTCSNLIEVPVSGSLEDIDRPEDLES